MSYLLRVELPDVPGSLGRLASAIGTVGGNIDAIEIVERRDGNAVDDVFLNSDNQVMPDSIVSACQELDGVTVLWVSRYAAGSNLTRDLEAVEEMTAEPAKSVSTLLNLLPQVLSVDWAALLGRDGELVSVIEGSSAAPDHLHEQFRWDPEAVKNGRLPVPEKWSDFEVAGVPVDEDIIVIVRRGGPAMLDSEVARLGHLVALALTIRS